MTYRCNNTHELIDDAIRIADSGNVFDASIAQGLRDMRKLRPLDEWHEDDGCAVWYRVEDGKVLGEPPWIGTPLDSDWPEHDDGDPYYNAWTWMPPFPADPG